MTKLLLISFLVIILVACSSNSKNKIITKASEKEKNIWRTCSFSNKDFSYEIDSCNCGDIYTDYDSIFVNLFQGDGGEIQGRLLKINYPICDKGFYVLMKHQNRYWTSSMGPDPVFTNWILYNSPYDTIYYDTILRGFSIKEIPEVEQRKFPKFDTLDFYRAYKNAVSSNLQTDYVPDIAKGALYREYTRSKNHIKEVLQDSDVELHRIIIELHQSSSTEKVIIFNYGHFG